MFSAAVPDWPANHSLAVLSPADNRRSLELSGVLNSFIYDWSLRNRLGGLNISWFVLEETPLTRDPCGRAVCVALSAVAPPLAAARDGVPGVPIAITEHERVRLRAVLDALVATHFGVTRSDFAWILRDCDLPVEDVGDKDFCRALDPKGFWRIDKDRDPELRHTVLSLAAFDDLHKAIAAAGPRDAGIEAWCAQNDGDGWMLPETLCIADLGLTRTVSVEYDERSKTPQPVRSRMGERFLDWQLAQTPEESWAECERHARALGAATPAAPSPAMPAARPTAKRAKPVATKSSNQASLPGFEN
jgi:hypothetical protein